MQKSIIIVGAGLAGLATGCYAQMNEYKTQIFEMQNKPGGVCVSWKRNGYSFDYAVHNVFGVSTKPTGTLYNQIWEELGALKENGVYSFKEFVQVEDTNGKTFAVYTDIEKLKNHMKELSQNDAKLIEEFTKTIEKLSGKDIFEAMLGGVGAKLKILPLMSSFMKYGKINLKDFAEKFSDPFLKKAISTIQYDLQEIPTIIPMIFLSMLSLGDAGWPLGGSSTLSRNIEKQYLKLGGEVNYFSKVKRIIVENDIAKGIELEDGSRHFADLIISAADGHSTIFSMLNEKYTTQFINQYYNSYPKTQPFGLTIWYGVNNSFTNEPHAMVLFLEEPIVFEDKTKDRLDIEILNFDRTLAPPGKCVVKVNFDSSYDYWKELSKNPEKYKLQKQQLSEAIAKKLEKRFPQFSSQTEAVDVVTPVTVEHWTGGYRGFAQPWPPPQNLAKEINKSGVSKTLPGLQNFHMVGQWAGGTFGISTVCLMGRNLVRELCQKDHKKFITKTAT